MRILVLAVLSFSVIACGTGGEAARTGGLGNILSGEEIAHAHVTNAYQAVKQLRPLFLQKRSTSPIQIEQSSISEPGTSSTVLVYVDNHRYGDGDVSLLQDIPADQIQQIEYINASDATTRFGTGHTGGVIMVVTKKKR